MGFKGELQRLKPMHTKSNTKPHLMFAEIETVSKVSSYAEYKIKSMKERKPK